MASIAFTYTVYYWNRKLGQYLRIAEVTLPTAEGALDRIFNLFNSEEPLIPVQVQYFYNPRSIRSMSIGDLIEMREYESGCAFGRADDHRWNESYLVGYHVDAFGFRFAGSRKSAGDVMYAPYEWPASIGARPWDTQAS